MKCISELGGFNSCSENRSKMALSVGGTQSFFVQAGASHVYAIEASPQMAAAARQIVKDNGFSNVVTVIEGLVEDAEIPVRMMTRFDS